MELNVARDERVVALASAGSVGLSDAKSLLESDALERARDLCSADSGVDGREGAVLGRQSIGQGADSPADGQNEIPHSIVVGTVQP